MDIGNKTGKRGKVTHFHAYILSLQYTAEFNLCLAKSFLHHSCGSEDETFVKEKKKRKKCPKYLLYLV